MAWFFGHIPNKNPNSAQAKGTSWPKNTLFSLTQTITVNSFHQVSPGSHAFKSQDTSSTSLVANSLVVTSKDRRDSSWWKIQVFLHLQPRGHMHKHAQTCENYGLTPSTWFWDILGCFCLRKPLKLIPPGEGNTTAKMLRCQHAGAHTWKELIASSWSDM